MASLYQEIEAPYLGNPRLAYNFYAIPQLAIFLNNYYKRPSFCCLLSSILLNFFSLLYPFFPLRSSSAHSSRPLHYAPIIYYKAFFFFFKLYHSIYTIPNSTFINPFLPIVLFLYILYYLLLGTLSRCQRSHFQTYPYKQFIDTSSSLLYTLPILLLLTFTLSSQASYSYS